jgi:exonuclease SbcC
MSVRQDLDVQEGERLAALAAALDAELEPLRHQLEIATEAETAALAAVSTGQRARLDAAAVARYREALEQARSRLPQLAARKARLRSVHEAIESDTARLAGAEQSAASLTTAATDAAAKAVAARRAAEIARGELDTARQTLVELGDAATRRTEHEAAMIASTHAAAGTRPVAERLQGVAAAAIDHRDAAQRDFETAMRGEAAATAAQRHAPGDPCPVCARALPKGWRRPAAPLLDMAGSALEQAKAAVAMAERDAREAADEANAAQHRVALAAAQSAELERSFARVVARLESQLGDFAPDIDDDEALNGLVVAAAEAAGHPHPT